MINKTSAGITYINKGLDFIVMGGNRKLPLIH